MSTATPTALPDIPAVPIKKQCKLGDIACTVKYGFQSAIHAPKSFLSTNNSTMFATTLAAPVAMHTDPAAISKDTLALPASTHKRSSSPLQTLCSMACQERTISAPLQLPTAVSPHSILYTPSVKREESTVSDISSLTMNTDLTASPMYSKSQHCGLDKSTEKKLKHIQTDRDRRARIKNSLQQLRNLLGMANESNVEQSTILSNSVTMITQLQQDNHLLRQQLQALQSNGHHSPPCAAPPTQPAALTSNGASPSNGSAVTDNNIRQEVLQLREHVNTLQCRLDRELKANSLLTLERRELSNKLEQVNAVNQQLSLKLSHMVNHNSTHTHTPAPGETAVLTSSQSVETLNSGLKPLQISADTHNKDVT